MKTFSLDELQQIRATDDQRRKSLVKFAKKLANTEFSKAQSYSDLLKEIVQFKRLARVALRGEL